MITIQFFHRKHTYKEGICDEAVFPSMKLHSTKRNLRIAFGLSKDALDPLLYENVREFNIIETIDDNAYQGLACTMRFCDLFPEIRRGSIGLVNLWR